MWLRLHDRLEQRDRRGTDLLRLAQHPCRRPFRVTPMAGRHVLRDRRVLVRDARAHVARDPLALVEDLDGAVGETRLNGLPQQPERHRVVMVVDLDMIVGRDRAALPLGILVALARKPFQRRPVETGKRSLRLCFRCFITFALIFVTQSRTASFNSAKEKKRLLRSLPSTKRETMPTAASTLALAKAVNCRWCGTDDAPKGPYHTPRSSPPRSQG